MSDVVTLSHVVSYVYTLIVLLHTTITYLHYKYHTSKVTLTKQLKEYK